jgi:hypothetical protein
LGLAVILGAALLVTPLERKLWSPAAWFAIVTVLQVLALATFGAVARERDRLGNTALGLAIATGLFLIGFVLIFRMIGSLSGLR